METQINMSDQNIQQIGQNPLSQPVQVPEKQKFNFWAISAISLFLILLVVGGLYFYRLNSTSLQNKKSVDTVVTKSKGGRPDISSTKTGWKTYNNSKFYYSFSYPSGYSLTESKNLPENILQQVVVESASSDPSNRKNFIISVKKAVNLEKEVKYQKQTIEGHILASLKEESKTAKDGLAGVQLYYEPMAGSEGLMPFTIVVLGYEDISFIASTINDYYSFVLKTNIDKLTYSQETPTIADEIFSTFKQLSRGPVIKNDTVERFSISSNPSVNESGWKTYTEKTHGFTIEFPSDWSVSISKDDYDVQTLTLKGSIKWTNSGGGVEYPELNIGSTFIYSTSGAICANESSCDKIGTLTAAISGIEFSTPILRLGSIYGDSKTSFFNSYRLDFFQLDSLKSKPVITAKFGTKEQGQIIADILSTITY